MGVTRVGVLGAFGGMGSLICDTIEKTDGMELVARVGDGDPLTLLAQNDAEVVVDVTTTAAAKVNLQWLAMHEMHVVVGTSGLTSADLEPLQEPFVTADTTCFVVPNFSIGAVLMMRFAEQAAYYFDDVEIIELHRESKKDAPSGTARFTAERIGNVRQDWRPDATEVEEPAGVRGGLINGIPVHSIRLHGLLAHQEVLFGTEGETFTIRHDSLNRSSFMPGVVRAIQGIPTLPPGVTVGLDAVLSGN